MTLPARDVFGEIAAAVDSIRTCAILGLARRIDATLSETIYSYRFGVGGFVSPIDRVPVPLRSTSDRVENAPCFAGAGAVEWHLDFAGAKHLVSVPLEKHEPATRLWFGFVDPAAPTADERHALESLGKRVSRLLERPLSTADETTRLQRLELAAGLLPALMQVLDIREVFDPLSEISKRALPHDMLTLGVFDDELTRITMYARTGTGPDVGGTFPQPYPPEIVRDWHFDIVDDRESHPLERDRPPTKLGSRSSIRVQLRSANKVIGGLGFMSFEKRRYSMADVEIARRLADYLAVTLSHQRLAEQARLAEGLRARAANLELLDDLLASLIDTGDLRQVFARISTITQKVLPHDAAWLPIVLPDGRHAKMHAVVGVPMPSPDIVDVPEDLIANPNWESEVIPDLTTRTEPHHVRAVQVGFRSVLRAPVRLEGRFAGTVLFASKTVGAFAPPDILVARRIADRLALLVARDREVEAYRRAEVASAEQLAAAKRADEASARAAKLESRVKQLVEELDARTGYRRVVGDSVEWRAVLKQATQVAPNDTTVLLLGESGTGKEVIARFVHRASPRANGPFIAINCAALPDQLLEAELFGYERGAYTGAVQSKPGQLERAAGGTLFLDEVGEMSLSAQAKFLRVLQEREFQRLGGTRVLRTDARIIAATNRDLERAIGQNLFREDLYYRLNVFAILLPALRDRRRDILPLSEAFLGEIGRSIARPAGGISPEARDRLLAYHWPGNVRELRNILERASILCDGGLITPEHLSIGLGTRPAPQAQQAPAHADAGPLSRAPVVAQASSASSVSSAAQLKSMEREMIEQALVRVRFNKSKAAKDLGLTRQQLYIRMKKYGLE